MANRMFKNEFYALDQAVVFVTGIVSIAADATVSSDTLKGATVARTGTGAYTITLTDKYPTLLACNLTLEAATLVDLQPQIVSTDVSSAKTIVFKLAAYDTDGVVSATDPAAVCKVHVSIILKNSGVA